MRRTAPAAGSNAPGLVLAGLIALAGLTAAGGSQAADGRLHIAAPTGRNPANACDRKMIHDFLDLLYGKMDIKTAFARHVAPEYVQHHPGMPDGRDAAVASLAPLFANPDTRIEVRQVMVDGDRAAVEIVGHMGPKDPGSVVINIFRCSRGKIVEHWDVTEPIKGLTPSGRPPY